ncbi:tartrate-resistant acid phosphatase type 5-like isoform X2 [Ptychodera flava]|uniref:tartrate-resistant acid phosphatase type 5-like isoform X2 n=1 Tax=Ptychodera flava TaxID=63121 RepID=UPI003969C581
MMNFNSCVGKDEVDLLYPVYKPNENSLRYTVLADWGGIPEFPYRTPIEKAVGNAMGKVADTFGSQFTLALGDNFYFDGVKNVDDKRFTATFEEVFLAESLQNPWYLCAGNHDHNGNISAQIEYSKRSERWNFPDTNYSKVFDIPHSNSTMLLVMIDTVILCGNTDDMILGSFLEGPIDPAKAKAQFQWIEDTLKQSKHDYIIVAGHYPVWSIAEHGPTECLVKNLKPMLEKYSVTAYFNGHDHNLQHIKDNSSVEYFVIGSGAIVDPSTEHIDNIPAGSLKFHYADPDSLGGFAYVEVTPKNMSFTFIDATAGKDLYQTVLYPRTS